MPSFKRYVVASADLDRSRDARLRAACESLLDRQIRVALEKWDGQPAHLLVAGTETSSSRMAVDAALRRGVPVLRIGRLPWDPQAVESVDINVAADALADRLQQRLAAGVPAEIEEPADQPTPAPFLRQLLSVSDGVCLLERGLFRLVVDLAQSRLHMLRRMPYPALIAEAMAPNWFVTQLTPRRYAEEFEHDVTMSFPLESVLWDIAIAHPAPIAAVPDDRAVRLRAWPVLSATALPMDWLLPLSCLLDRAWPLPKLAQATAMPAGELTRLYAAVLASGLADTAAGSAEPARRLAGGAQQAGLLQRLARRFGLSLGKGT